MLSLPRYGPCMPLHYVDPNKKHGRWYTALESFGRSRPGQFLAHHLFPRIDPWLYRATGGRYPSILGGVVYSPADDHRVPSRVSRASTRSPTSTMGPTRL